MIQWACGILEFSSLTAYCCRHIFNFIELSPFLAGSPTVLVYLGLWVSWDGGHSVLKRRQSGTNQGSGHSTSGYSFLVAAFSFFLVAIIFFFPSANINYRVFFQRFLFFIVLCAVSASFELLWFTYFSLSFALETFHTCLATGWSRLWVLTGCSRRLVGSVSRWVSLSGDWGGTWHITVRLSNVSLESSFVLGGPVFPNRNPPCAAGRLPSWGSRGRSRGHSKQKCLVSRKFW